MSTTDAIINATYVSVYNANWRFDGEYRDDISGYAYIPDINDPGKLKVVLDGVPVEGDCKYIGTTANSSLLSYLLNFFSIPWKYDDRRSVTIAASLPMRKR